MTVVAIVTTAIAILFGVLWRQVEVENAHLRQEIDELATAGADRIRDRYRQPDPDAIMTARLDAHNERVEHPTFGAFGRQK